MAASVESFVFEPGGGNGRFNISWIRTGWSITYKAPITFIRPLSGGSASGRNTDTIEFTVGANENSTPIFTEIAIEPTSEGVDTVYVDVMVKTSTVTPDHHDYDGVANCVWLNDYRFEYNAIIQNNTTAAGTFYDIYLLIASTDSESVNPDSHGQLERRIRLGTITIGDSETGIGARGEYPMTREPASITGLSSKECIPSICRLKRLNPLNKKTPMMADYQLTNNNTYNGTPPNRFNK